MSAPVQKKICMLGGFSVRQDQPGQALRPERLLRRHISPRSASRSTRRPWSLPDRTVNLILWDVAGEDDISSLRMSYLRGAAGYVLVADGTRPSTLEVALSLRQRVEAEFGSLPFVLLLNKNDLKEQWAIADAELEESSAGRLVGAVEQRANRRRRGGRLQGSRRPRRSAEPWRACPRASPERLRAADLWRAGGGVSTGRCRAQFGRRRRASRELRARRRMRLGEPAARAGPLPRRAAAAVRGALFRSLGRARPTAAPPIFIFISMPTPSGWCCSTSPPSATRLAACSRRPMK